MVRKEKGDCAKDSEQIENDSDDKMIGITGALAMGNCQENDDIDLLIITGANFLWLTRLLIVLLSPFLGIKRRKPKEKNVKDKICFNLFLEENHLKTEPENLFLAHEICQVKPLINKGKTYEKFLWNNRWVKDYLPNSVFCNNEISEQSSNGSIVQLSNCSIAVLNKIAFFAQRLYMRPKMTVERVSLHQAFFHPQNLQEKTRAEYEKRIGGLTI